MLTAPDLSGFDLPKLAADLEASALRQDRCRRLADAIGIPDDCRETAAAAAKIDADAAATAEAARLVSAVRRFVDGEAAGRQARVNARQRVALAVAPRPGLFARTLAAIARAAGAEDPRPLSKPPLPRNGVL